jgi:hypothetical protein
VTILCLIHNHEILEGLGSGSKDLEVQGLGYDLILEEE